MNIWNSLSDVVDTDNLDKFKTRIDEFWRHKEVLFDINQTYIEPETDHSSRFRDTYGLGGAKP